MTTRTRWLATFGFAVVGSWFTILLAVHGWQDTAHWRTVDRMLAASGWGLYVALHPVLGIAFLWWCREDADDE